MPTTALRNIWVNAIKKIGTQKYSREILRCWLTRLNKPVTWSLVRFWCKILHTTYWPYLIFSVTNAFVTFCSFFRSPLSWGSDTLHELEFSLRFAHVLWTTVWKRWFHIAKFCRKFLQVNVNSIEHKILFFNLHSTFQTKLFLFLNYFSNAVKPYEANYIAAFNCMCNMHSSCNINLNESPGYKLTWAGLSAVTYYVKTTACHSGLKIHCVRI